MTDTPTLTPPPPQTTLPRERLLRLLSAAIFLLFFQTYMVAPLIPSLADSLSANRQTVGLLIPAYTIPYALTALLCGVLADRLGRRSILFFAFTAFPLASLAMAAAPTLNTLLALRVLSGISNVGIAVVGLSLVGDLFPPKERGRALGWIFGAIAGGGAFGSTLGGLLAPLVGWRGLFLLIATAGLLLFLVALPFWKPLASPARTAPPPALRTTLNNFLVLLRSPRGARTFSYIFLNAIFHSGVFTWLGVLLHDRFALGEIGVGLALLGYGIPGLLLGPYIGKIVDRHGRRRLIPAGLLTAAITAALLAPNWPLPVAALAITLLSLGFDMSHPLFAGIIATLDDSRRGQAMGLNTCSIFLGYGCGSLLFGALAAHSMPTALLTFAAAQTVLAALALPLFKSE